MTPDQEQGLINTIDAIFNDKVHPNAGTNVAQYPNLLRTSRLGLEARAAYLDVFGRRNADAVTRGLLRQLLGVTPTPLRVLVFGDSIAAGHNSADGTGLSGWLGDLLNQRPDPIAATFDRTGAVDGAQLGGVAAAVPGLLAANPGANLAILMVGTNDASFTQANYPPSSWATSYGNVVDQILTANSSIKVVCCRTVLAGPMSAGWTSIFGANQILVNSYIDTAVAARVAGGRVVKADMSTIPSSWLTDPAAPEWHPGDAGYLRMARTILDAAAGWLP